MHNTVITLSQGNKYHNSPVIEQFRFNKIALFSFSVDLGWSTCVEARIQNLPQSALGKLPNFTKIQDGRHYLIQNHKNGYILQITRARYSNLVANHMFIVSRNALKTFSECFVL